MFEPNPEWRDLVESWKSTQSELRRQLITQPLDPVPRFVAGADAAFSAEKQWVFAAAVVYDRVEQRIVEIRHAKGRAQVPYVPGFLTFREGPTLLEAIRSLKHEFGVICFDGQGYAHPRRCGLAAHMSILLDVPGVGVAKTRLIGRYEEPAPAAGSQSPLMDKAEQIGVVLRTRDNTNPLFISVGQKMDLPSAVNVTLSCITRYRIPEPTRQADIEVAKLKRAIA
jgi:deoxyribonuclease V